MTARHNSVFTLLLFLLLALQLAACGGGDDPRRDRDDPDGEQDGDDYSDGDESIIDGDFVDGDSVDKPDGDADGDSDPDGEEGPDFFDGELALVGISIRADSNLDGILNPGEEAEVELTLRNRGETEIGALAGSILTQSPHATITCGKTVETYWGYGLYPGESVSLDETDEDCYSNSTMTVAIKPGAPAGSRIPFVLELAEEAGQSFRIEFFLTVMASGGAIAFSSVEVINDSNIDGIVSPGELAQLRVTIENVGTSRVTNLSGTIFTASPWVNINCGEVVVVDFGYALDPGDKQSLTERQDDCYTMGTMEISVDPDTPVGTEVVFAINLVDTEQAEYETGFTLTIMETGGALDFDSVDVLTDTNYDKIPNPGEEVVLRVFVRNTGSSRITNLRGTIHSPSQYVDILCGSVVEVDFDNIIDPGERQNLSEDEEGCSTTGSSGSMEIFIDPGTPVGQKIEFDINLVDTEEHPYQTSFKITVQKSGASLSVDEVEILTDSSGNDKIEAGDQLDLRVWLSNTGSSRVTNLSGDLSSSSSRVTLDCGSKVIVPFDNVIDPEERYYLRENNTDCSATGSMKITISPQANTGQQLPFELNLKDIEQQNWHIPFSIEVQ